MKKTILCFLSILLFFYGCATMHGIEQPKRSEQPTHNLSKEEVVKMADAFAKQNREADNKPFILQNYPHRRAQYSEKDQTWWVDYIQRPPYKDITDHFSVRINDLTGEMLYFGAP